MSVQFDELAGLKKLLAALQGDEHSKMIIHMNGNDVTKNWIASLRWEIEVLESHIARLKKSHADRT